MKKIKIITIINDILSVLLWLLGLLVLIFNLLGNWTAWHLAGFSYFLFCLIPITVSFIALIYPFSDNGAETKKYIRHIGIVLGITVIMTLLTIFVFSMWFW